MPDATPAPPSPDIPNYTHPQILRVITGVMLCIFLASLDQTVVIPAVPAIAGDLQAFGHLSWIVTAYLLTSTAATPVVGKLSDVYGRRALLLPSLLLFIVASMACGFATSLPALIVARAFQGLGGAGLFAMAQASIADVVSPRERGRYQGYMASMWGVSSIAGPILGGWATDHLSWRWVFWANLPVGLLAMALCNRGLRVIRHQRRAARIDWAGAGLLVGAVSACLLMLTWGGNEVPWLSVPMAALLVTGLVLLAVLVWWERLALDPVLPPRLFGAPDFRRGVFIAFVSSLGLFGATFLLPLFLQLMLGFDASTSGLLVMPYLASTVVGAMVSGQAARRIGRTRSIILSGLALCLVGYAGLAAMAGAGVLWPVLAVAALLGLGTGMTMPSILMQVQNGAPYRDVGAATGSVLFLRSMGGAFGSTVVGAVLTGRFAAGLAAAGITTEVDLGAMRHGAGAALGGIEIGVLRGALSPGFQLGFAVCGAVTVLAVVAAWGLRDVPLRGGATPSAPAGH